MKTVAAAESVKSRTARGPDAPTAEFSGPIFTIDKTEFQSKFNREPFYIRHHLVGEPLFELPKLIELATSLPEDRVEYNAGDLPVSVDPSQTPRNGLSVEETIRRIEECRSWMVLKNVETNPGYCQLLDRCLDEIGDYSEPMFPGMCIREGFIFITSPGAVTPFHMDPEFNFLLQLRGSKQVTLFSNADRSMVCEQDLESFYSGGFRNLKLKPGDEAKGGVYDLRPGQGLHFPITAPHWVKNGPEVSISFSITFRTPWANKREALYRINRKMRQLKLRPTPVGKSSTVDGAKYFAFDAIRKIKKLLTGSNATANRDYEH